MPRMHNCLYSCSHGCSHEMLSPRSRRPWEHFVFMSWGEALDNGIQRCWVNEGTEDLRNSRHWRVRLEPRCGQGLLDWYFHHLGSLGLGRVQRVTQQVDLHFWCTTGAMVHYTFPVHGAAKMARGSLLLRVLPGTCTLPCQPCATHIVFSCLVLLPNTSSWPTPCPLSCWPVPSPQKLQPAACLLGSPALLKAPLLCPGPARQPSRGLPK